MSTREDGSSEDLMLRKILRSLAQCLVKKVSLQRYSYNATLRSFRRGCYPRAESHRHRLAARSHWSLTAIDCVTLGHFNRF
jgi:hypothetical protein